MSPSPPKPPAPPPPPPTIDQAAQQADANNLIRRRQGYAATVLSKQTTLGSTPVLDAPGARLGSSPLSMTP